MENQPNATSNYRTMKQVVYDRLRHLIVTGQFPSGKRLIINHLAKELGVSPTPVREALHKLEVEGLIKFNPYHGAEVSQLSIDEIVEIYHIRAALETLVTHLAASNLTFEDYSRLDSLINEMEQASKAKDLLRVLEINHEFHLIIWSAAKSPRLCELLENYYDASQRFRYVSINVQSNLDQICEEHGQIVKALRDGNVDLAGKYAGDHLERTAFYLLGSIKTKETFNSAVDLAVE